MNMDDIEQRVKYLRELLTCFNNLYFSEYDSDFNLVYTSSEYQDAIHIFLSMDMNKGEFNSKNNRYQGKPTLFTNSIGMTWTTDVEIKDGEIFKYHLLGPVFLDDIPLYKIEKELQRLQITTVIKREMISIIQQLPIVPLLRMFEYGIMLHYCLTGARISNSDFMFQDFKLSPNDYEDDTIAERSGTFLLEQKLMQFVEEGNINYHKEKNKLMSNARIGKLANADYIRLTKNAVIIYVALCTRAAIRGGMPVETAYLLSDRYIQNVEDCTTIAEINEINTKMYDDFVNRVHMIKSNSGISPQIQECCDYISLHIQEKLNIHEMASRVGYTDYYLTKKFKQETGLSIREYAAQKKIERAKDLLKQHDLNIQDISDRLGFSSQSYFGDLFHKSTGMSPGEFRMRGYKK